MEASWTPKLGNNAPLKTFLKHFKAHGEDIKMPVQSDAALATVCVCVHTYVCMFWKILQGNKNLQILTELWVMESEETLYFFSILFYNLKEVSGKNF